MSILPKDPWRIAKEWLFVILGILLYILAWSVFLVPNNLVGGGVTGIASIIQYATHGTVKIGYTYFVINAILLVAAFFIMGSSFGAKTIFAIVFASIGLNLAQEVIPQSIIQTLAIDNGKLMSTIMGGIMAGLGIGLSMSAGGSTGGTDIIALIVSKYRNVSPGKMIVAMDFVIILSSFFIPSYTADGARVEWAEKFTTVVYGLILVTVNGQVIDMYLSGSRQSVQLFILAQQIIDLAVASEAQCAQERGDRQLARPVHADPHDVVGVDFVLQPCAAARNDLRVKEVLARAVDALPVVYARGADQLGYDDALAAVDDEGAVLGHEREIAHEHLGLLHLAGLVVGQTHRDLEGGGIGHIPLTALRDGMFWIGIQGIVRKLQLEISVEVSDRRDIVEHLAQVFLQEFLIGVLLDLDQVRHVHDFFNAGKALADPVLSHYDVVYADVLHDFSFLMFIARDYHECHHP